MAVTKKFFLFRKEPVNQFSVDNANTGDGLSVLGVPADRLARVTATLGAVTFFFKDAGVYDSYSGDSKEAIPLTRVSVSAQEGKEYELIEQVLNFIARQDSKAIMRFDVLSDKTDFTHAKLDQAADINSVVNTVPVITTTGVLSNDPANTDITSTTTTTIAGVTFPSDTLRPIIDYNETALTSYSIGAEVGQTNHWHNQGTGGTDYEMNANTGAPVLSRARNNDLATNAVTVTASDALHIKTTLTVTGDYTMYMVYGIAANVQMYPIYGSASSTTQGFGNGTTENRMYFTHDGNGNRPAFTDLGDTTNGTKVGVVQDPLLDSVTTSNKGTLGAQICYVWVIRRDKDNNIFIHDYTGEVVGFVPALLGGGTGADFITDGDLTIDRICGDGTGTEWKGEIARFGLIESDIGVTDGGRIARELFARYNYYPV